MNEKEFRDVEPSFRPAPFWAINDRIASEEAARQMAEAMNGLPP